MIRFLWHFWLHDFWYFAAVIEISILSSRQLRERMYRGVIRRWLLRNFGVAGWAMLTNFRLTILIAGTAAIFINLGVSRFFLAFYWTFALIIDVIDVLTGGNKPKRRWRKKASEALKKLRIAPPPRPAIGV